MVESCESALTPSIYPDHRAGAQRSDLADIDPSDEKEILASRRAVLGLTRLKVRFEKGFSRIKRKEKNRAAACKWRKSLPYQPEVDVDNASKIGRKIGHAPRRRLRT